MNHRPEARPLDLQGDFGTWTEAKRESTGYESNVILEKTRDALLQVTRGEAAFERDSMTFAQIDYSWPTVAGLMFGAARSGGRLEVLDFGGSLGSSYFQNRRFLSQFGSLGWNVVEQPSHVEAGRATFETEQLRFYSSIGECLDKQQPNVGLLGGVIQYVEHPYSVIRELLDSSIDTLIIDRTPFWDGDRDRLCVQTVPPQIYPGSYPSWIFSRNTFHSHIPESWERIAEFRCSDSLSAPVEIAFEGLIIVRKAGVPQSGMRR